MKKLLLYLLAAVLTISFCGCAGKSEKPVENFNTKEVNNTNVASYVEKGNIDFSEVAVGMGIDEAIDLFHKETDMEDGTRVVLGESYYGRYKGLKAREINNDVYNISNYTNTSFIYDTENENNGIIAICCVCDVYGFQNGITMSEDVINALGKTEKVTAKPQELYFLPVRPETEALKYQFGANEVTFYFVEDFLSATVISSAENYDFTLTE